jgi:hypothetical protein
VQVLNLAETYPGVSAIVLVPTGAVFTHSLDTHEKCPLCFGLTLAGDSSRQSFLTSESLPSAVRELGVI